MRRRTGSGRLLIVFLGLCVSTSGCGGNPDGISVPSYDPSGASRQALKLFDENQNGTLEASELSNCPSLLVAMPRIDADGNGKLTAAEVRARIAQYQEQAVGLMSLDCIVSWNGQPLPNAKVTFVPEEFLKGSIQSATGITDNTGRVGLKKDGIDFAGIQVGLYRVQISLQNESGVETIPEQYNTKTTLGADVAPDVVGLERGLRLELKPSPL